ncbi:uncharacterized protein LOC120430981 isoform X4 [Culex pipiens pallens]|uniref:uncharacterized protein LOC120430981 isoform X4 n=1 Tax=Culex pipiens pallens TaxID=42434 RepID=UPI0022A9F89A|nr:uncharacterized protein LOC120430981 isoform X4 [Culex pipiens pallens]
MLINLAELNEKLREYRTILTRLKNEQEQYRSKRERLSKLSQRRRPDVKKSDAECHICNGNIDEGNNSSFATCRGCERLVCRNDDNKCCEWISAIGIWECRNCHSNRAIQQKAGEWLLNQLTIRLQNPGPVDLKNDTLFGLDATDHEDGRSSSCSISSNQKVKVREFIEELLSSMLNGPLDDVSVGQLMKNENYLPLCEGQKVPDSPSDKHFELRKLVQRVIDEVTKLPEMLNQSGLPLRPEEHLPYFSPKKYEQLLATAVLNKVVEDYRNPKNFEDVGRKSEQPCLDAVPPTTAAVTTGSALAKDSSLDINHNNVSGIGSLNEVNIRQMSLNTNEIHSQDDLLQRSLSESDESYLSDYIQRHTVPLPDLSDTNGSGSGPEDDLVSLKSNITEGTSWEENWLFRKRQLKTTESAIAMLVPSPTEDVKALIGDQIVDDVSDLSEADGEDYDSDINNNESGDTNVTQTTLDDAIQDSLISINSIPSNEPTLSEAKNSLLLTETLLGSASPDGLLTDLISIEQNSDNVEAANATLLGEEINDTKNAKPDAVETDDVKLMQERIHNAPKQRDNDGNVMYPIGVARAINTDNQTTEYGRKEVPIEVPLEHTYNDHTFKYTNNEYIRNLELPIVIDKTNNNQQISAPVEILNIMPNTYPESTTPASIKLNSETIIPPNSLNLTQPLSPHPIAMTITEIFEQSMKPHLTSISEEEQDFDASTIVCSTQSNSANEHKLNKSDINEPPQNNSESKHHTPPTTPELFVEQGTIDTSKQGQSSSSTELTEITDPTEKLHITKDQNLIDSNQGHKKMETNQDILTASEQIILRTEVKQEHIDADFKTADINVRPNSSKILQENTQFGKTDVKLSINNQPPLINIVEESQIIFDDTMTIQPDDLHHTRQNMALKKEHLSTSNEMESLNKTSTVDGTAGSQSIEQSVEPVDKTILQQKPIKLDATQEISTQPNEAEVSIDHTLKTAFYTDNTTDIKNDKPVSKSKNETKSSINTVSPESKTDEIVVIDKDNGKSLDSNNFNIILEQEINNETLPADHIKQENTEVTVMMDDGSDDLKTAATAEPNCLHDELQECYKGLSPAGDSFNYAFFNTIDDIEDTTEPSSPEDTSTEAIAGSIDRVSSPEEQDLKKDIHLSNELLVANALQHTGTDYKSNSIYEIDDVLLNLGSEASSVQSTPIAMVTQQMRQYCEELKGILHPTKTPDSSEHESDPMLEISENIDALEFFQDELCTVNEQLEACEFKTPTEPKSKPFPEEKMEIKTEISNHSICNIDYVEEEHFLAEDVGNLAIENLEHTSVCDVIMVSPSVGEHAVKNAISLEYTACVEPCATLTTDKKTRPNKEDSCENPTKESEDPNYDELPPPPLELIEQIEGEKNSKPLSVDTQHLLTISTQEDYNLPNNSTTNLASKTNDKSDLQKLGASENELISLETDPSDLSQILEPLPSPIQENDTDSTNNDNIQSIDENLIPGSIAERDILKWRNASPIPNNPYSPDILQKRLSESNRSSNLLDFDRLTNKDKDVPIENQPILSEDDKTDVQDQSLLSERGGNQIHNERYGRDYYINDAKRATGSRKLGTENQTKISHSTDDEKSLLLSQKQPNASQRTSPVVSPSHTSKTSLQTGVFPFVKSSSCGNVIPTNKTEDIFSAGRPVQVAPTDPILQKGTKLEYLSTPAHEVYLIPASEPITPHSLESLSEQSIQSRADESLTMSEDSDITRIYEIGTGETKLIQGDAIQGVVVPTETPPPTPDKHLSGHVEVNSNDNHNVNTAYSECAVVSEEILEILPQTGLLSSVADQQDIKSPSPTIDRSHLLKPRYVQIKQLSPDTIKFFSPKKPFTGSTSNLSTSAALSKSSSEIREHPVHTSNQMHSSLHIDFPANRNVPAHEFIIEKEVMDVLPSVKELAKCYSGNNQGTNTTLKPIMKPTVKLRKDFIRQSSDMLHDDQESRSGMPQVANKNRRMYSSTNSIIAAEEIREIRRLNLEAYNRPTFVPMAPGHSITARSLSKQIREELKTNATDDFKVQGGHISPERPSSPVFAPGHLRNSIQFFENLKDK